MTDVLLSVLLLGLSYVAAGRDIVCRRIPPWIYFSGVCVVLPVSLLKGDFFMRLFSTLFLTVPLLFTVLLYERFRGKEAFGGGDLKLIALLSFGFSFTVSLWGLFLSLLTGAAAGLFRKLRRKEAGDGTFPFVPFIALGWTVAAAMRYFGMI